MTEITVKLKLFFFCNLCMNRKIKLSMDMMYIFEKSIMIVNCLMIIVVINVNV